MSADSQVPSPDSPPSLSTQYSSLITPSASPDLKNFLPQFLIPGELFAVVEGQHVGRRGAHFFHRLHVRMRRGLARPRIDALALFAHRPTRPEQSRIRMRRAF